jgi:Flp pilus assembly protein CpaB
MKTAKSARIIVLIIALVAGGVAADLASGIGDKPPPAQAITLQTVDVLVAKADIGLGQTVTAEATNLVATVENALITVTRGVDGRLDVYSCNPLCGQKPDSVK